MLYAPKVRQILKPPVFCCKHLLLLKINAGGEKKKQTQEKERKPASFYVLQISHVEGKKTLNCMQSDN